MYQQQQQRTDTALPYIILVIAIVLIGVLVVQVVSNPVATTVVTSSTSATYATTEIAIQNQITAETLLFNHQIVGLAPNWNMYVQSLNWADYPISTYDPLAGDDELF